MGKTAKWVLGILIALLVVVVVIGVGFRTFAVWRGATRVIENRAYRSFDGGRLAPRDRIMPRYPNRALPRQRFGFFSPLRFIGGMIIYLGILSLVVLGIVYLVRKLTSPAQPAMAVVAPPVSEPAEPAIHDCPNCSQSVQNAWKYCPNCGTEQK